MDWNFDYADNGGGNVALMAQMPTLNSETSTFDIVVGFGDSLRTSTAQADGTLRDGYDNVLAKYNGVGEAVGWEDYLGKLTNLPAMVAQTRDGGKQLYASALVLKAMEDKETPGR